MRRTLFERRKQTCPAAEGKFLEAEQNYDRQRQLLSRGHTTRQRYDAAVQTLNTLRGQADVARAQLATAQKHVSMTRTFMLMHRGKSLSASSILVKSCKLVR